MSEWIQEISGWAERVSSTLVWHEVFICLLIIWNAFLTLWLFKNFNKKEPTK